MTKSAVPAARERSMRRTTVTILLTLGCALFSSLLFGETLAELSKQRGCVSTPVSIDGTDLFKCMTQTAMTYFAGPQAETKAGTNKKAQVGDSGVGAPPLEFKGVPLGATPAQLMEKLPPFECRESGCSFLTAKARSANFCDSKPDPKRCLAAVGDLSEFGLAKAIRYSVSVLNGVIGQVEILVEREGFDELVAAMRAKYGKPIWVHSSEDDPDKRSVWWNRSDGKIRVFTLFENRVVVQFTSRWYDAAKAKKAEEKARGDAKRL